MLRFLIKVVVAVLIVAAVVGAVFVAGMRTRSRPVIDAVRRVARWTKPLAMRTAGKPGAYASVVHHVGRTSGARYDTPVQAVETDDGFAVALPYGSTSDWVRNVLAAGSATITHNGSVLAVDRPEVVPLEEANRFFPQKDQRTHRRFGLQECLLVRRTSSTAVADAAPVSQPVGGA